MKLLFSFWLAGSVLAAAGISRAADHAQDRFVWVFGWGLGSDKDVEQIGAVLDQAGSNGFNGAVLSAGLDTLCKKSEAEWRRLEQIQERCRRNHLEVIPSLFSIGYGGGFLSHNRQLAEGLPVQNALFVAQAGSAHFVPEPLEEFSQGAFEDFKGDTFIGFGFQDGPGKISFADLEVRHSGKASLRLENFTSDPYGHARVMKEIQVRPHRSYRIGLWVKTRGFVPTGSFRVTVLAGNRDLAPRTFNIKSDSDWRKCTMIFNSLTNQSVRLYAGVWGGKRGTVWIDDWTIEEIGPVNVLRRPGTPVRVSSDATSIVYEEGRDYFPLRDPDFQLYQLDRPAPVLKLPAGSRIQPGERLRVSWRHPMLIYDSQVTVCMAEPEIYEIMDHEAKLLAEHLHPKRILLNMDEIRMGGTCEACRGRNMAELLGGCITKEAAALKRHNREAQVYIWSDMLDPNHNAHGNYYLVNGDYTGSWNHVPKDLVIAIWGGAPREKSVRFFDEHGFQSLISCYYDAANLDEVKSWLGLAHHSTGVRGFMYTTWEKKYQLLPDFGRLILHPAN